MICIKLDREISCEYICQEAQKLVNNYHKEHGSINDCLLVMTVKRPLDHTEDNPIPKLELKQ